MPSVFVIKEVCAVPLFKSPNRVLRAGSIHLVSRFSEGRLHTNKPNKKKINKKQKWNLKFPRTKTNIIWLKLCIKPFHSLSEVFGHEQHLQHAVQVTRRPFVEQAMVLYFSCRAESIINVQVSNCLHKNIIRDDRLVDMWASYLRT